MILYLFTCDKVSELLKLISADLSEWYINASFVPILIVLQTIAIICIEIKRREVYVKITSKGIIVHNGNGERFGLIQLYKPYTIIKYKHIISCYISTPYDILPEVKYLTYWHVQNTFRNIRGQNYIKKPYLIPAIYYGRYNVPCIYIELDTNMVAVLAIDNCDEFLEIFNKFFSDYKRKK